RACRHGRLLRLGGGPVRYITKREGSRGGRTAERAGRGGGGVVRGAQVRRAFGHAAALGGARVSACDLRGGTSGALPRVFAPGARGVAAVLSQAGNGVDRRSLRRPDGHRAAARAAAASGARAASGPAR